MNARLLFLSITMVAAACGGNDRPGGNDNSGVSFGKREAGHEQDDIVINTIDGGMSLAVRADSIRMRLSDSTLALAGKSLDSTKEKGGFGASMERFVKRQVKSGLSMELSVAISSLKDARVENGVIVLENKNGSRKTVFDGTKVKDRPLLESFRADDAERFVTEVRSRIGKS